jgi:hypothetical protein
LLGMLIAHCQGRKHPIDLLHSPSTNSSQSQNLLKTPELGLEIQRWERLELHAANSRLHPMVRRSHGGPPPFGVGLGVVRVSLAG